jgi:hypothetical protein
MAVVKRFEVLEGSHVVNNEPIETVDKGGVVETEVDLAAKFGSNKFKYLGDVEPVKADKKGAKAE